MNRCTQWISSAGLFSLALASMPWQGAHAQALPDGRDPYAASRAALLSGLETGVGGAAVGLVARGDQILFLEAVGDIGSGDAMPVNAIARLASIQKPITAAAVLILYERGELQLSDRADRWFPGLGQYVLTDAGDTIPGRAPTIRELLTHRAGIIPFGPELDELWGAASNQEFARGIAAIPLRFPPGARFEYGCCGAAYEVLAAIVEQVSGISFEEYLEREILGPLHMTDSHFFVPEAKWGRLSAHYGRDGDDRLVARRARGDESPRSEFFAGGGSLRSTVLDYHRFTRMLLNGGELDGVRILRPETVEMMTRNQIGEAYPVEGFGWGFGVRTGAHAGAGWSSGSYGWNGGTGTAFEVDPSTGIVAIVFAPSWPGTPGIADWRSRFLDAAPPWSRESGSWPVRGTGP